MTPIPLADQIEIWTIALGAVSMSATQSAVRDAAAAWQVRSWPEVWADAWADAWLAVLPPRPGWEPIMT